jgi:hypothetical protein
MPAVDEDRFDALTRSLASPRRAALRALAGATIGALVAVLGRYAGAATEPRRRGKEQTGLDLRGDAAQPAAAGRRRSGAACRVEQRPYDLKTTFTTKLKKQKLSLTTVVITPLNPQEDQTNTTTIKRGPKLLLRTEQTTADAGRMTYRTTYGAGFAGIAEIVLVVEGGTIGGEVDGRALVPFPANAIPAAFAFQDGEPAPELRVSESTKAQIKQMLERAAEQPEECVPASSRRAPADRGGGVQAEGGDEDACTACKILCFTAHRACEQDVWGVCSAAISLFWLGYAACMAAGIYGCHQVRSLCLRQCRETRDCCPVPCGDLPDWSCCFGGRQCLTPRSNFGVCCEVGYTPCHETTCCAPFETCREDGQCCPAGTTPCHGRSCCAAGEACMPDGSCCPAEDICGGLCCDNNCCNNACCQPGESCDPQGRCARICRPDFNQYACPNQPGFPICCQEGLLCCPNDKCCFGDCCEYSPDGCCPPGTNCCATPRRGCFASCER